MKESLKLLLFSDSTVNDIVAVIAESPRIRLRFHEILVLTNTRFGSSCEE